MPAERGCSPVANDVAPSKVSWKTTVRGVLTCGTEPTSAELDTSSGGGAAGSAAGHGGSRSSSLEGELPAVASIRPPKTRGTGRR